MHKHNHTDDRQHRARRQPRVLFDQTRDRQFAGILDAPGVSRAIRHAARCDEPAPDRILAPPPLVMSPAPTEEMLAADETVSFPLAAGTTYIAGLAVFDARGLCREVTLALEANPADGRPLADKEWDVLADLARERHQLGDVFFSDKTGVLTDLLSFPPSPSQAPELVHLRYTAFSAAADGTFSVLAMEERGLVGWFVLDQHLVVGEALGMLPGRYELVDGDDVTAAFIQRRLAADDPVFHGLAVLAADEEETR
jgi:hypothetical protein